MGQKQRRKENPKWTVWIAVCVWRKLKECEAERRVPVVWCVEADTVAEIRLSGRYTTRGHVRSRVYLSGVETKQGTADSILQQQRKAH